MKKSLDKILFCLQVVFCLCLCLGLQQNNHHLDGIQIGKEQEIIDFFSKPHPPEERLSVEISQTPSQFDDVDEGDFVKYDENSIYVLTFTELKVIDIKTYTMKSFCYDNFYPIEMTQTAEFLILIGIFNYPVNMQTNQRNNFPYQTGELKVMIAQKETMQIIRTISFLEGNYQSLKIINDEIYIIVANNSIFNSESRQIIYPKYIDSKFGEGCLDNNQLYFHKEGNNIANIILIYHFNLLANNRLSAKGLIGIDGAITLNNEYLILSSTLYEKKSHLIIHLFDVACDVFAGSIKLEGYLTNAYAMSTYHGYLRIGMTSNLNEEITNTIYNIDIEEMKISARLNYGKMEQVYSIRFDKDYCYLTTYLYYSPVLLIDMINPRKIFIRENLSIDFVNEYLEISDNVLSIGRKMTEYGTAEGLVVAQYQKENLEVIDKYAIIESKIDTEIRYNFKALCRFAAYVLFPVNIENEYSIVVFSLENKISLLYRLTFENDHVHRIIIIDDLCFFIGEETIFVETFLEFRVIQKIFLRK